MKKLYLILVMLIFLVGCDDEIKMETGIGLHAYLNPEGDILAILIGPRVKGSEHPPLAGQLQIVLLELNEDASLKNYRHIKSHGSVFRDMAWHPTEYGVLYFSEVHDIFEMSDGQFLRLDVHPEDSVVTKIKQFDTSLHIATRFSLSPDGKVFLGSPLSRWSDHGKLVVSCDGGKSYQYSGIETYYGYPRWINNEEFYIDIEHAQTNARVRFKDQEFAITETTNSGNYQRSLTGVFGDKPIFVAFPRYNDEGVALDKSRRLIVGDSVIHDTDGPFFRVHSRMNKIAVEANSKITIYDESLIVCHEIILPPQTHLFDFHPQTNTVFLIENWKTLLFYDYTKEEKPHILFSVDMLNVDFSTFQVSEWVK